MPQLFDSLRLLREARAIRVDAGRPGVSETIPGSSGTSGSPKASTNISSFERPPGRLARGLVAGPNEDACDRRDPRPAHRNRHRFTARAALPPVLFVAPLPGPPPPLLPPNAYRLPGAAPARLGPRWGGRRPEREALLRLRFAEDSGFIAPTREERRWLRALYDAELRWVDDNVGRLVAALRDAGLYESCVVAFTSDHGEEFWEQGSYEHGHTLYDELIRVPLAFRLPHGAARGRIATPVSTQSLTATLLELLTRDAGAREHLAPSLVPHWREAVTAAAPAPPLVSTGVHFFSEKRSVVQGWFKVIENLETGRVEVYDLLRDPGEQHPLEDADEAKQLAREAFAA